MPRLKHKVNSSPLASLRAERAQAEEWLRGRIEDFIDNPGDPWGLLGDLKNEYLPRYRAAWMRVRKAERKETGK